MSYPDRFKSIIVGDDFEAADQALIWAGQCGCALSSWEASSSNVGKIATIAALPRMLSGSAHNTLFKGSQERLYHQMLHAGDAAQAAAY